MIGRIPLIIAGGATALALLAGVLIPNNHKAKAYLARFVGDSVQREQGGEQQPRRRASEIPPATGPVRSTQIGINLSTIRYFSGERAFANLAIGSAWMVPPSERERQPKRSRGKRGEPGEDAPSFGGPNGELSQLPPSGEAIRRLTPPSAGPKSVAIRCTYTGSADVTVESPSRSIDGIQTGTGELRFTWLHPGPNDAVTLHVRALKTPIVGLDCREAGLPSSARFDPQFVDTLKRFKVVRFMNWQNTNENTVVDWQSRHTPASIDLMHGDGAPIEDIVALSNATGTDPWVNVPWNASADYVRRFAQMMHDGIPANRTIYVELSNEVWNWHFSASKQAAAEGQKAGLSNKPGEAQLLRYAQRTIEVMSIWEQVFRDRPARLVRVLALQNSQPERAAIPLGLPGLVDHIDALASAPYFGHTLSKDGAPRDLDAMFGVLNDSIGKTLDDAAQFRSVAESHGKRYIAYEAGQHVVLKDDIDLLTRIERDPRMYEAYRRYLTVWQQNVGDLVTLFDLAGPIGKSGAWGLVEYQGQPLSEAPKMRAVVDHLDAH